jgi:hypothetical protein
MTFSRFLKIFDATKWYEEFSKMESKTYQKTKFADHDTIYVISYIPEGSIVKNSLKKTLERRASRIVLDPSGSNTEEMSYEEFNRYYFLIEKLMHSGEEKSKRLTLVQLRDPEKFQAVKDMFEGYRNEKLVLTLRLLNKKATSEVNATLVNQNKVVNVEIHYTQSARNYIEDSRKQSQGKPKLKQECYFLGQL